MKYTELNIKENMPPSQEAMFFLKSSLERFKRDKIECVLVAHGYGSTGRGGVIHDKVRLWLKVQEINGKVKSIIFGEDFTIFNFKALELKNRFPQLKELLKVSIME